MKWLLPHRFKAIGAVIAPLGFALWLSMQFGYISKLLNLIWGPSLGREVLRSVNITVATLSFFSFLFGVYMVAFSRERVEDEMVQKTRLDSFQFAALIQIIAIVIGFTLMIFFREPEEGGMMLFFISLIFLFWLSFLGRFNYILHMRLRQ